MPWYRGNTHCHTNRSDGDADPVHVARWYRDHGYAFLAITDHNIRTDPEADPALRALCGHGFLILPGEEASGLLLHFTILGAAKEVGPPAGADVVGEMQEGLLRAREAGGVAVLNHPNFFWRYTHREILRAPGWTHLELWNAHPLCFPEGDEAHPSVEAMWDHLLSRGRRILAIACDDAHHFGAWGPHMANPGRAWIVVHAPRLAAGPILEALRDGRFYASTGIRFERIAADDGRFSVEARNARRIEIVGEEGEVLAAAEAREIAFPLRGDERYVRARARGLTDAIRGWTQPFFPGRDAPFALEP